jgi:Mn-dependent DtxR family transcriptional regulator
MLNRSTEDYLKAICRLQEDGGRASTTSLARHLGLAGASVTDMLKRLSAEGLVHYEPYRGVELTPEGRRLALRTLRRHRLWEMFLVRYLGFSWSTWNMLRQICWKNDSIWLSDPPRSIPTGIRFPRQTECSGRPNR